MRKKGAYSVVGSYDRAYNRWMALNARVNNPVGKNACYAGVKVLIDQYDFIRWFRRNDFEGGSVDRIDKLKHYEKGNLKMIPLSVNCAKDKLIACEGMSRCRACRKIKPVENFVKERRRANGLSTICKPCENERTKLRNARRVCNSRS